jgi:predicted  nucleic acid-binding Zn-ribbon protein
LSYQSSQLEQDLHAEIKKSVVLESEHAKALDAVKLRYHAEQAARKQAASLQSQVAQLRRENAELKSWADVKHPDSVRMLINSAAGQGNN